MVTSNQQSPKRQTGSKNQSNKKDFQEQPKPVNEVQQDEDEFKEESETEVESEPESAETGSKKQKVSKNSLAKISPRECREQRQMTTTGDGTNAESRQQQVLSQQEQQPQQQKSGGDSSAPLLRLDLNLEADIKVLAQIHGDVTLELNSQT